jgi:hypothetical protein
MLLTSPLLVAVLGLAVGIPLGVALERGGFCMNTAFRSIIFEKDKSVLRAYVLVLMINVLGVAILEHFAVIFPNRPPFFWLAAPVGGFVFGVGMVLAGGCSCGSYYRFGRGMVGSFLAVIGFAVAATVTAAGFLAPVTDALQAPVIDVYGESATLLNVFGLEFGVGKWIVIGVLVAAGAFWLLRSPKQRFVVGWNWKITGVVVGAIALGAWVVSGLTLRDYGLSFTQPTVAIGRYVTTGDSSGMSWATYQLIGVPIGALVSSLFASEFSLRMPKPGRAAAQFGGGLMMGFGAAVAGGCNIGHGITGISSLALASVAATVFAILGVWTMTGFVYRMSRRKVTPAVQESVGA